MLSRLGATAPPDRLAVAFVLAHPFVDVALSGAATVEQLGSHVAALGQPIDTPPLADLAESPERYWKTRASLPWT
jgi:aryl-alcohol dehydrogenase-like predicted oxidoreductase